MAKTIKKAVKKPAAPKQPSYPFTTVHLRGSAFTDNDKAAIAKFMRMKGEKQATTAVMRMVHQYFRQEDILAVNIKEINALRERILELRTHIGDLLSGINDYWTTVSDLDKAQKGLVKMAVEITNKINKR